MAEHLRSKNLVPFKRKTNEYRLPLMGKEREEEMIDQVDPDLRPEEQGYVRHFLAYADTFLRTAKEEAPDAEIVGDVELAESTGEISADSVDAAEVPRQEVPLEEVKPERERKKDIA